MKSRFHAAADAELSEAVAYYDERAGGLGDRLIVEIKTATRSIEQYPLAAPISRDGVRARPLVRFPYTLLYVVEEHELFIIAVAHQSRRPAYWVDRLPAT